MKQKLAQVISKKPPLVEKKPEIKKPKPQPVVKVKKPEK